MVSDETGAKVPPGNYEMLAQAAMEMLNSDSLGKKSGNTRRIFENKYSLSITSKLVFELYAKTLS
jgi:glycosyltransferase involved in cell wall biosynthesis